MRSEARIRFLSTSFRIPTNVVRLLQTLPMEASLLIDALPGTYSGTGSEVPQAFKGTSATHIIAIYRQVAIESAVWIRVGTKVLLLIHTPLRNR